MLVITFSNKTFTSNKAKNVLIQNELLVFQTQTKNGNLKVCQIKIISLLLQQIIVFLENCYG